MTSWLNIVGTNHISTQSIIELKEQFLSYKPDIIAIELDKGRLQSLLIEEHEAKEEAKKDNLEKKIINSQQSEDSLHSKWKGKKSNKSKSSKRSMSKTIKAVGVKGYLFLVIASFIQKKMGRAVGMTPGGEMKFAIELARNNNLNLSLIDQNIHITIKRLFKKITFKEKMRFLGDIIFAPFKQKQTKQLQKDLGLTKKSVSNLFKQVPDPDFINKLIFALKKRYPTFHKVLIDERNHFMAKNLVKLHKKNTDQKIMAVVGAGHKDEMLKIVKKYMNTIEII